MPLVVVGKGTVVYKRPTQSELPVIGRLVCLNQTLSILQQAKKIRDLSEGMYLVQSALLKEKKWTR